jgi:hypothetical protein
MLPPVGTRENSHNRRTGDFLVPNFLVISYPRESA